MADIDKLSIQISSDASSAVNGIEALAQTLGRLKTATSGGLGLSAIAKGLESVKTATDNMGNITNKLSGLARAVKELSNLGNIKVSASIGNQITKIGTALSTLDIGDGANKIQELVDALKPLETLGKTNLSSTVNALNKLPDAMSKIDMRKLHGQVDALTRTFRPLADEMQKVANGFNAFPSRIQKIIKENDKLAQSNSKTGGTFVDLWAKAKTGFSAIKRFLSEIGKFIDRSAEYEETVNRFKVSMGQYSKEHAEYATRMGELVGIDPAEWMGAEATFMALSTSFGIAGDRASTMSQQLTQLSYDIASFHDIKNVEDAFDKVKSGLAGEIEPLRAIGYDLSVARLQQEAYALGITKKVSAMTQAEKAELRYVALLKQSKLAQGDMARTMDDPANQLRIFRTQLEQTARSIGNVFIPILLKILPIASAVMQVIRSIIDIIASLVGYEIPEIEWKGAASLADGAGDASSALGDAADNAKKLNKFTAGFDELNVLDTSSGSGDSGAGIGSGGGFGFELPTYEFIDEETKNRISEISEELREWLGLTGEIDSWSDLFKTRLGGILILVGAIGVGLLAWKVIKSVAGVLDIFSKFGLGGGKSGGGGDVAGDVAGASAKLKTLAKNMGLGVLIIAEVVAAAAIFVGGIWLIGWELEQVGLAWQPVIDNGATIAIAMGIGTALLVGIGFATAALGKLGGTMCAQMGIGIAILAEIGVAAGLFLVEIWAVGKGLDEIGKAWQPVLDNGDTIEKGIAIGTGLLVAIGVVTAALGMATVATAGALPLAIGLGTAILIELAAAFVLFCESLIKVSDKLSKDLHPALQKLNKILPDLNVEMENFVNFMKKFAGLSVEYTKSSAISGFSATIDTIIGFFTKDPIKALADDVNKQYKQSKTLNEKLALANPELETAASSMNTFKKRINDLKTASGNIDISDMATSAFTSLVDVGKKIASFGAELKKYYDKIKNIKVETMDKMVNCVNDVIDFAVRIKDEVDTKKIDGFTEALKKLTTAIENLPKSKTVTIKAVYETSGAKTQGFASGGFPETGQMFIAREAGPEMVGSIGNRTAVANNDQIVAGIASGVASANSESNALLREQNTLLRAMLEKESGVYLDGKKITKSVEKNQRERGRVLVTGGAY